MVWLRRITHFQPLSDNVPLIYVVRIAKDMDNSTMSNNLLDFSAKVWQAGFYLELDQRKGIKSKQWSGYGESHISQSLSDKVPLVYVVRIFKDIDYSILSNNLLNLSPKPRQARSCI